MNSPKHYVIDDLYDHRGFMSAVALLLHPDDSVAFSSYGSRPDIRAFLEQHQLSPDNEVTHERSRLDIYRESYPEGFAVRWPARPVLLNQLAHLLRDTPQYTDFCDHIIAYGQRGPLLSFHDAFQGDPLKVSSVVPEPCIQEFCTRLGVTYKLLDRKVSYDWEQDAS